MSHTPRFVIGLPGRGHFRVNFRFGDVSTGVFGVSGVGMSDRVQPAGSQAVGRVCHAQRF